jgi:transposase
MTIPEFTVKSDAAEPVRRFEVFTGAGRRREWPPEEKARIVAESYEAGETVSGVARRYALSPQQLFSWRRAARQLLAESEPSASLFVPAVVATPTREPRRPRQRKSRPRCGG